MTKTNFMDKYPIYSLELNKNNIKQKSVAEIVKYYKEKIDTHPIAKFIALFDHYSHTKDLGGEINSEILDAQNIIFCFGAAIPNSKILSVRPRSVGIVELEDKFIIEFLEAPKKEIHQLMEIWTKGLENE
jgi:hypothetical protein